MVRCRIGRSRTLASDHTVIASSGVWFATMQLDGVEVPVLLANPNASVSPPVIAGHGLEGPGQVVLGATTLAELHLKIGDTIELRYTPAFPCRPITLRVVGVATLPAIGIAESLHTSMSIGAIFPPTTASSRRCSGPVRIPAVTVRTWFSSEFVAEQALQAASRAAQRLAATANADLATAPPNSVCGGNEATVLSVQRPAQIVNYRSTGATPVLLAAGLALGAVVALGLALTASVRRRRRDPRVVEVTRVHSATTGRGDRMAGFDRGSSRNRRRHPTRHCARSSALDAICPARSAQFLRPRCRCGGPSPRH